MRILRLRPNQRLISAITLGLVSLIIIVSVLHYEITPASLQQTFQLDKFINLSNNQSHFQLIPEVSNDVVELKYDPIKITPIEYQKDKIESQIDEFYTFKQFLADQIFKPILSEKNIAKVPSLNNKWHYANNRKSGHFAGPVKESYKQDPIYTKQYLLKYLQLKPKELSNLKKSHQAIVKSLPKKFPDLVESSWTGSQQNGYVYVGGAHFNYLVLLSIKSLRDSGSVLPVEVLIPKSSEFDVEMCNYIFPIYNARCIVIEDYISKDTSKKINKYQMKSIALLINSFQNVMLLDSDNMILKNPDYLFVNEPFISKGFISWPDLWRRSTSPFYYQVSGIDVNEYKKVRNSYWQVFKGVEQDQVEFNPDWVYSYHDLEGAIQESSSESGQLLINKKTHAKTIFLSTYYNFYGPDYYYPLLTQNSHGEGDKDTYIAAAHALGQSYYHVEEYARDFHKNHKKVKFGKQRDIIGIGQYDPMIDYKQVATQSTRSSRNEFQYSSKESVWEFKIWKESEMMFLHCNWPKLYTWDLINSKGLRSFKTNAGYRQRLYEGLVDELKGRDFEKQIVGYMKWYFCEHKDMRIKGVFNIDFDQFCVELGEHYKWLEGHVY